MERAQAKMEQHKKTDEGEEEGVHLRREIGLLPAVCFIVGTVVGSGIFIAPKGVLMNSGSVGLSLLVWVLCGVLSLFGRVAFFLPSSVEKPLLVCQKCFSQTFRNVCLYMEGGGFLPGFVFSGALCYAELGTSFKKSGGHYTYLLETLGPLPAFLRLWGEFIFIR